MPRHFASQMGHFSGSFMVGFLAILIATPWPAHAQETCPCFTAEEIQTVCQSIEGDQTYGPSRGWGGLGETEGAAIECTNGDRSGGAYFETDAHPMDFSSPICTKLISLGTQDDVRRTEGIFEEHLAACREQLDKAAELLGGLK